MPVISSSQVQPEYDVIVVGSGAAGGQTAYTLTMEGAKVLMLEAGRNYDPVSETPMFQNNRQAPLLGARNRRAGDVGVRDGIADARRPLRGDERAVGALDAG